MTPATRRANHLGASPRLTFSVLATLCLAACAGTAPKNAQAPATTAPAVLTAAAEQGNALGIHVTGLRVSAGGFMVDLRYRVVDPELAKVLLDRKVPAYLMDEATGLKFGVPNTAKLGRLRAGAQNNIHTDRDYGMLFGNPGNHLKPGALVTLVAGDVEVPHLIVK
ncbi:MAG: hypothetical protein HZA64_09485 [Rhodocyclales bacterium]|nr:hypothetical protein [Rhodocyclales bacterium]